MYIFIADDELKGCTENRVSINYLLSVILISIT
jgi:hypothetical protein